MNRPIERVDVAGVPVSAIATRELIEWVVARATAGGSGEPALVAYANASSVCLARDDGEYARILREESSIVYPDGQAIVWAARVLGRPLPERVNAGDCWPALLARLADAQAPVYLLGGAASVAERATDFARRSAPGLVVAGAHDGYFGDAESDAVAAEIRRAAPAVVFVGMGSPRQERWAAAQLATMGARVVWCVGALFEYYAGVRSRAPVWMRRCGLEWSYRLALEPARLWRRYLIGNPRFVWLVLKQKLRGAGRN